MSHVMNRSKGREEGYLTVWGHPHGWFLREVIGLNVFLEISNL